MVSLPTEALLGISFGLLVGTVPASLVGVLGYLSTAYRGTPLPDAAAVAIALPVGGGGAVLLGFVDPVVEHAPRALLGSFVVVILALYGNSLGEWLGESLPRDTSLPTERGRTLSEAAVASIDSAGHVTVRASEGVRDVDGYPPLPPELRQELETAQWQLPADLPLAELETRLEDRLRTEYDLAAVSVTVDARGTATVAAAPPKRGVADRVPDGYRAVSVTALVPAGLSPGDEVTIYGPDGAVDGTTLSVPADRPAAADRDALQVAAHEDGGHAEASRITVAVPTERADALLSDDRARVVARSSGTRLDFEAFSLLGRAGYGVRKVDLDQRVREALANATEDVRLVAVEGDDADDGGPAWRFYPEGVPEAGAPRGFLLGPDHALDRLLDAAGRSTGVQP